MATINPGILGALDAAESFISGFEGDEMQEGIPELLAAIREAREAHTAIMTALETLTLHAPSLDATGIRELCDAAIAKAGG